MKKKSAARSIIVRVVLTIMLLYGVAIVHTAINPFATLGAGKVAGMQFDANDQSYVASQYWMALFSRFGIPAVVVLAGLLTIWWKPMVKWWATLATMSLVALSVFGSEAKAYYDKTDYAEPYFIMPNESAFWVPDVGDNKNAQVKFGSQEYFDANKIAAKRFVIPHTKLDNSGLFSNFYVPAGRLIIVDRTPYSREWVDKLDKGSSSRKEGFPCQSKEGLNITVGMSIGVSILEENASRFLYRFGAAPPEGNRADPVIVFQSVLHSRSLIQVMDTVGRNKVQALVCNEIGSRTFNEANLQSTPMMISVRELADKYFATLGITLDYLGWADTMTFDDHVQKAINDKYIAETIAPIMPILTQNADNMVKEGLGKGLEKHGLPANLIAIPEKLLDLQSMFSAKSK